MMRRLVFGLLVLACVLPAAGCGGGGSAAGAGAAGVVPAGVPAYVSIDTDFEGDQIQQARELLDRFPGSSGLLGMLESELESEGNVDFQEDVLPALGPRLDVVLVDVPDDGSDPPVVVLLQPEDEAKLDALLAKAPADSRPVKAEVDDWTLLADDQAAVDRFRQAGDSGESLEDSEEFEDAMDGLEEDALVRAYVDLRAVTRAAAAEAPLGPQLDQLVQVSALGAAASAEEHGFRLEAMTKTEQQAENFEPALPGELPQGAIAYLGFGNVAEPVREALNRAGEENPQLDQQLAQLELVLGLSLDQDVLPLFEQETALAVYQSAEGSDVPSFLVTLEVDDEQAAVDTIDRILERGGQFLPDLPQPRPAEIAGIEAKELDIRGITVVYAGFDGKLAVTNSSDLLAELAGDGPKLSEDATFQHASDHAELPDEVNTLIYVNLNEAATYGFDLAERSGNTVPPQVSENVEPLDSLLLYGTRDGDKSRVSGFLALDD